MHGGLAEMERVRSRITDPYAGMNRIRFQGSSRNRTSQPPIGSPQ
ncbi:hypothetical protein [Azospirillum palustre]